MIGQLTLGERRLALFVLIGLAAIGLFITAVGRDDVISGHGALIILAALVGTFAVISGYYLARAARGAARGLLRRSKQGRHRPRDGLGGVRALRRRLGGLAARLSRPHVRCAWASFGRLRPVHTHRRHLRLRRQRADRDLPPCPAAHVAGAAAGPVQPWFVLFGYNLFCVIAVTGYMMGITQSKEYAEPEWYADIWLVVVWVDLFRPSICARWRGARSRISTSPTGTTWRSSWSWRSCTSSTISPCRCRSASAKSYSLFSGVQDAMTQWWYGHNAVAFFLTAGFLGMMYYYLPKRAGRPIFSYRLSIISFWGITFFYMWAGSHHLHYTALPQWVQTLGMTFSVMLLVPSWASAGNALLTLNGAWHKVRDDATLRFMMVAAVFYGLSTFEGSFMAIRPVNSLSHYTDWTIGHVHAGALGWVAMITFGAIYASCRGCGSGSGMYSARLVEVHFWFAVAGTIVYVFAMWNSGIIQGLMWRTYNESGTLAYSFVDSLVAMHPYYIARAIGGLLFLIGAVVGCYNIWMTIRTAPRAAGEAVAERPEPAIAGAGRAPAGGVERDVRLSLPAGTQGDRLGAGHHRRRQHRRHRRDRAAVHHPRDGGGCAGHAASTRRSNSPAATSTSAKAATPATRR